MQNEQKQRAAKAAPGQTRTTVRAPLQEGLRQSATDAGPGAAELETLQRMADQSPQVARLTAMQRMADDGATPIPYADLEDDELQTVQRQPLEEKELLQGKALQRAGEAAPRGNNTGLPDNLKAGIERLSGLSMDHVRVHRNSDKPAAVQAHAFAQGSNIHLAPGQEQHLQHEAWHVVQQAQGRVKPTMQMNDGVPVNDDAGLEREADVMGARAAIAVNMSDPSGIFQRRAESVEAFPQPEPTIGQGDKGPLKFPSITGALHDSPRMVAQRLQLQRSFGPAQAPVQRVVIVAGVRYKELQMVPGTNYRFVQRNWRPWAPTLLYDTVTQELLESEFTPAQARQLTTVFANLELRGVVGLGDLIKRFDHTQELGLDLGVQLARLNLIDTTIQNVVLQRIQADHALIVGMCQIGMLDPTFANAFQSIEITDSDPHKGGQVVAFINYHTTAGNPFRVVYKPGDLGIDRLLFGDQPGSVSQTLGGRLASYRMETRVDIAAPDERQRHYGYMQFVDAGVPVNAADVTSVYTSLGENLALAYVFGFRDIHEGNFILLADRIQLIDMEAATGTFKTFAAMELSAMPRRLEERIADGLVGISNADLTGWLPTTAALQAAMRAGFISQLMAMGPLRPNGAAIGVSVTAMSTQRARFVPFPTGELKNLVGTFQGKLAPPLPGQNAQYDVETQGLATSTAGGADLTVAQLLILLRAQATREAVNRGDVPFWTRIGNDVYEEHEMVPIVAAMVHPRLDTVANIAAGANTRRDADNTNAALAAFDTQAMQFFNDMNASILYKHLFRRNLAGNLPPNY